MAPEVDPPTPLVEVDITDLTDFLTDDLVLKLNRAVELAVAAEGVATPWNLSLVLTSDAHLQQLHEQFLSEDSPTDIMTFPMGDEFNTGRQEGEIVISVDRAREQAEEAGWPLSEELAFLAVHGVLHLLGWKDLNELDRNAMLSRQHEILGHDNSHRSD